MSFCNNFDDYCWWRFVHSHNQRITHRHQWRDTYNGLQWYPSNPLTCESPYRCRWGRGVQEIQPCLCTTFLPNHLDVPLNRSENCLNVTRISHGNTHSKMYTPEHVGEYREGSIGTRPFMQSMCRRYIVFVEYMQYTVQEREWWHKYGNNWWLNCMWGDVRNVGFKVF